jgi:hypothetical protein
VGLSDEDGTAPIGLLHNRSLEAKSDSSCPARLAAAGSRQRLLPAVFCVTALAAWASLVPASRAAPESAAYLLVWKNTATGVYSFADGGGTFSGYLDVIERGSEVIHVRTNGTSSVFPVAITRKFERDTFTAEPPCTTGVVNTHHEHQSYTDPGRWTGVKGEYAFGLQSGQRTNGVYYLDRNTIYDYVALAGFSRTTFGVSRLYTLLTQEDGVQDCGRPFSRAGTKFPSAAAPGMNINYFGDIESTNGLSYHFHSINTDPSALPNAPVTVEWDIQVRKLGECASEKPPLPDSPAISSEEVKLDLDQSSIPPDGTARLTVTVTCDGVVVQNAPVEVTVRPEENSGGHAHEDAGHPRPRGYLKKPGATTFTKLTEAHPNVTVNTDARGTAVLTFRPGRDTLSEGIGISGLYHITAKAVRFPDRTDQQTVTAELTGLGALASGTGYSLVGQTDTHPDNHYGTAATLAGVAALAQDFQNAQIAHNAALVAMNETPWATNDIQVNDISLVQGGLFDVVGYDFYTHQYGGTPWQPPHHDHFLGTGVDMNKSQWGNPGEERYDWLVSTLKSLGNQYGTWVPEPSLHLAFNQGGAAKVQGFALLSAGESLPAPDLGVVLNHAGPTDQYLAAAGQTIRLVAAVENLHGTELAHDVELSLMLAPGLTFVSSEPSAEPGASPQEFRWPVGNMPAGALPIIFAVKARLNSDLEPETILTNLASVTTSDPEVQLANNTDAAEIVVQATGPDLAVDFNIESVAMTADRPVNLQLFAANAGNALAPGATLRLTLPSQVKLLSASPTPGSTSAGTVVWPLGDLPPDSSQSIAVTLVLDPSLAQGASTDPELRDSVLLSFTLEAECKANDIDARNNLKTVVKTVELSGCDLAVWAAPDLVRSAMAPGQGTLLSYVIGYGNFGNQIASSNALVVSLSPPLTLLTAQPPPTRSQANTNEAGVSLFWSLPDLSIGQSGTIRLQLNPGADSLEEASLLAAVSSQVRDIHPDDNTAYLPGIHLINTSVLDSTDSELLSVARSTAGAVIAWPFPSTGFVLESSTNLNPSAWQAASETQSTNGAFLQVVVPTALGQRYFRLRQP